MRHNTGTSRVGMEMEETKKDHRKVTLWKMFEGDEERISGIHSESSVGREMDRGQELYKL